MANDDGVVGCEAIANYYGEPIVFVEDGRHYFQLDNWDKSKRVEVSEAFYSAFVAEFGSKG